MTIGLPGPGPAGSAAEGRASSPHAVNSGTRLASLQQPARPPTPSLRVHPLLPLPLSSPCALLLPLWSSLTEGFN